MFRAQVTFSSGGCGVGVSSGHAPPEVKKERPGFYVTRILPLGFPGMDIGQLVKSVLPCGYLTEMK